MMDAPPSLAGRVELPKNFETATAEQRIYKWCVLSGGELQQVPALEGTLVPYAFT